MADTYDLLTYAEALAAIQQDSLDVTLQGELERLITAMSAQIVARCGPVVNRTYTSELHHGGSSFVRLDFRPVSSVTTVYERDGTTQTTITAEVYSAPTSNDYILDADEGILWRRSGGSDFRWAPGRRNIAVTYVGGRAASTATVPAQFKAAAEVTLVHLWRPQKGVGSGVFGAIDTPVAPWALPKQALDILGDKLLGPGIA